MIGRYTAALVFIGHTNSLPGKIKVPDEQGHPDTGSDFVPYDVVPTSWETAISPNDAVLPNPWIAYNAPIP